MDQIAAARDRLEGASELPAILGAAYDAFEVMLPVIEEQQDPGGGALQNLIRVLIQDAHRLQCLPMASPSATE